MGTIIDYSFNNPGFIEFTNGLIINFGINEGSNNGLEYLMAKPFKNKTLATASNPYVAPNSVYWGQPSTAYCINLTKIRLGAYSSWGMIGWIAIGY